MIAPQSLKRVIVGILIAVIFLLGFIIIKPLWIAIFFGILFAYLFRPVYNRIRTIVKNKDLAAFILVVGMLLLVIIPLIFLVPMVINQAYDVYTKIQNFDVNIWLKKTIGPKFAVFFASNIDSIIAKLVSSFMNQLSSILLNLFSFFLKSAVFLFTFYFAVRDSDKLKQYLSSLSPFSEKSEKNFLKEFRGITNAVIFGQILTGILQGVLLGIGLYFLGVENVIVLTVITAIASIIPFLGSWVVWFPIVLILFGSGDSVRAIILFAYGLLFVSTIDNIIRPFLVSKKSRLPLILSFIGTIGGLYAFGIVGLIIGPLVLAYIMIILELYKDGKLNELFQRNEARHKKP